MARGDQRYDGCKGADARERKVRICHVGIVTSILSLAARMVFVACLVSMETDSINDFVEAYVFALVIPTIYAVVGHNNTASKHIITLIFLLIFGSP